MKKTVFLAVLLGLVFSSMVFAADSYVVQSVNNVKKEVAPGKWEMVTAGSTLSSSTVLDIGISGNLELKLNEKTFAIKSMKKDTLENLLAADNSGGIKIGGKITSSNIAVNSRAASGTATASTRASDAASGMSMAEE